MFLSRCLVAALVPPETDRMASYFLSSGVKRQPRQGRRRRPSAVDPGAPGLSSVPRRSTLRPWSPHSREERQGRPFTACAFPTRIPCFPSSSPPPASGPAGPPEAGPANRVRFPSLNPSSPLTVTSPHRCCCAADLRRIGHLVIVSIFLRVTPSIGGCGLTTAASNMRQSLTITCLPGGSASTPIACWSLSQPPAPGV